MRTNAPKMITWWIAGVLGLLGIIGLYGNVVGLEAYAPHLLTLGFIILALATILKGV